MKFIFYLNFRKKIKLSTPSNKFLCWANTANLPSSEINEARDRLGGSFSEHWSLGPIEQGGSGGGSSALLNQMIFQYFCGKGSAQREGHLGKQRSRKCEGEKKGAVVCARVCTCRGEGTGRIVRLLGAGDVTGGGQGWELERRLGSTCQGPSVSFMSKEQARPQQVPFVGC